MEIEKCPYHEIDPEYEIRVFREELSSTYTDKNGILRSMTFPRLANHCWFCPSCRKEVSGGVRVGRAKSKLASGYCSRESSEKAIDSWNAGISRLIPAIIRAAVKGKEA